MYRAFLIAAFSLCAAPANALEPAAFQSGKFERGELRISDGVAILTVEGTPEEIGRQTGKLLIATCRPLLQSAGDIYRRQGLRAAMPVAAALSRAMIKRTPEYDREILTALDVSGLSSQERDQVAIVNALLELRRMGGCSALLIDDACSSTDGPLFGRNFDLPYIEHLDTYSLLVVARPTGKHAFAAVTFPGLIGIVSGMNEHGLAVATLDVYDSKDDSLYFDALGTPLTFTFRKILEECRTVDEAEAILKQARRTTWMNLAVCDTQQAAVFELTPKTVSRRGPDQGVLPCTNHFRSTELGVGRFCSRYETLRKAFGQKGIGVAEVHRLMDEVKQGRGTLQTMVFEPRQLRLHVSLGPPPSSARALKSFELSRLFQR